jgi:hypothetical protein
VTMDANIAAIMHYQNCTREEAHRYWYLSMEMAAESHEEPAETANVSLFRPRARQ